MSRKITIAGSVLILWAVVPVCSGEGDAQTYLKERGLFIEAKAAINRGRLNRYRALQKKLQAYPLLLYLEYAFIRKTMRYRSQADVDNFFNRHHGHYLGRRLKRRWLRELARRGHWREFLNQYTPQKKKSLRCYHAYALFREKRMLEAVNAVKPLWLVGRRQPRACNKAFERYGKSGFLTQALIWQRAVLALQHGKLSLARELKTRLNKKQDMLWLDRWIQMHRDPEPVFERSFMANQLEVVQAIAITGVKRIARRDVAKAWEKWQQVKKTYSFTAVDIADTERYLAFKAVYQGHPDALKWFSVLENPDSEAAKWRIRLALRQGRWMLVKSWIEALDAKLRAEEKWRYWYARALQELGKRDGNRVFLDRATGIYVELAESKSYFGFLAADRTGIQYPFRFQPMELDKQRRDQLANNVGIIRARELFYAAMYADARREWETTIGDFDQEQLRLAASLANEWGWHDRAILTYGRGRSLKDSQAELPYPMAFRPMVMKYATRQKIDPAWVYGVLRQESVFMSDVRSHAGALGLMQIMPRTGRVISRLTRIPLRRTRDLLKPEKNIQLGSAYLRMLLEKNNGNPVLATASYNAGAFRTKTWLPERNMDADIWVETIPFTETRRYVGKVLAYTVIFDHLLNGNAKRLHQRMPAVGPFDSEALRDSRL